MISINMTKALDITKDRIRASRNEALAKLDVAYMRKLESGDAAGAAEIGVEKQRLRDLTSDATLAAASDVNSLKAAELALIGQSILIGTIQ